MDNILLCLLVFVINILILLQYFSIRVSIEEDDVDYLIVTILSNIVEMLLFTILGGYNG